MEGYTPREWEKSNLVVLKKLSELANITAQAVSELDEKIDEINPAGGYIYGTVDFNSETFTVEGNSREIAGKIRGNKRVTLILEDINESANNKIVYVDCVSKECGSDISSFKGVIMYDADINFDDGTVITYWGLFTITVDAQGGSVMQVTCTLRTWETYGFFEVPE